MEEVNFKYIVSDYLNGQTGDLISMTKLMSQAFLVLFAGIIIWKITASFFSKPKKGRERKRFLDSKYQEHWKNQ